MKLIICIFAMMAAILAMLVLLAFIIGDIKNAKRYRKAMRTPGRICENYGIEKVAYYGRHQYRKYGKYLVNFETPMGMQTQEVLLKNKQLQKGDWVEVRYVIDPEGVQIVDNTSGARLLEIGIIFIIVFPLCLIYIFMKERGM